MEEHTFQGFLRSSPLLKVFAHHLMVSGVALDEICSPYALQVSLVCLVMSKNKYLNKI